MFSVVGLPHDTFVNQSLPTWSMSTLRIIKYDSCRVLEALLGICDSFEMLWMSLIRRSVCQGSVFLRWFCHHPQYPNKNLLQECSIHLKFSETCHSAKLQRPFDLSKHESSVLSLPHFGQTELFKHPQPGMVVLKQRSKILRHSNGMGKFHEKIVPWPELEFIGQAECKNLTPYSCNRAVAFYNSMWRTNAELRRSLNMILEVLLRWTRIHIHAPCTKQDGGHTFCMPNDI